MSSQRTPRDYKNDLYKYFFEGQMNCLFSLVEDYKKDYPDDPYLDDVFNEDFSGNFRLFAYRSYSFDQDYHREQRALREHAALSIFSYDAGLFFLQTEIDPVTEKHIALLDPARQKIPSEKARINEGFFTQRLFFEKNFDALDQFFKKSGLSLESDHQTVMVYYKQKHVRGSFLATLSAPSPFYAMFFLSGDEDHLRYLMSRGVTLEQLASVSGVSQDKSLFDCVLDNRSITEQYFNERCALSKSVFEKEMIMQGVPLHAQSSDTVFKRKI